MLLGHGVPVSTLPCETLCFCLPVSGSLVPLYIFVWTLLFCFPFISAPSLSLSPLSSLLFHLLSPLSFLSFTFFHPFSPLLNLPPPPLCKAADSAGWYKVLYQLNQQHLSLLSDSGVGGGYFEDTLVSQPQYPHYCSTT